MKENDRRQFAQARMVEAKAKFSQAAVATLEGNPRAVAMTNAALAEIDAARSELLRLEDSVPVA